MPNDSCMYSLRIVVACMLAWWLCGCERDIMPRTDLLGYDYYPLVVGSYRIYEVENTDYAGNNNTEQRQFYLKELTAGYYLSQEGDTVYLLERYVSNTYPNASWQIDSVWAAYWRPQHLVSVENNRPFVRLAVPVRKGRSWNINVYNTLAEQVAVVDSFDVVRELHEQTYVHALRVLERFDSSLVGKNYDYRYYTKNIGLIEWYSEAVRYRTDEPNIGSGVIESGRRVHYKLIAHGQDFLP